MTVGSYIFEVYNMSNHKLIAALKKVLAKGVNKDTSEYLNWDAKKLLPLVKKHPNFASYKDYPETEILKWITSALAFLNKAAQTSKIEVCRLITLNEPTIENIKFNSIGIYWSVDPSGVGAYDGETEHGYVAVIHAYVDKSSVNWLESIVLGAMYGESQLEAQLYKGSKVNIIKIDFYEDSGRYCGIGGDTIDTVAFNPPKVGTA
jgi:hypothetical protein